MRRTVLSIVAALVVIFSGPQSFSQDGAGNTYHRDILNNYYSDNGYDAGVGWDERDCSGYLGSGGSATNWRLHQIYSCEGVEMSSSCEEYQPGVGWVSVQCPDAGVTEQARVHITVG